MSSAAGDLCREGQATRRALEVSPVEPAREGSELVPQRAVSVIGGERWRSPLEMLRAEVWMA